ncbi:MAG TPA: hypothetical protein VNW97_04565 [Candidatus Saccharimonadales bacterium]|jgi:hypothetical protein|nr:hypothetical protein [Candidatus Saccharimonadales bacterium]
MRFGTLLPLTAFLFCISLAMAAQQPAATPVKDLHPASAALFKNGLAFVLRNGQAQVRDGQGQIDGVPSATLGSLWIATSSPGTVLEEVVAFSHKEPIALNASTLTALLAANAGQTVTVAHEGKQYTGEIMAQTSTRTLNPAASAEEEAPSAEPLAANSSVLLLNTAGKIMALSTSEIKGIEFTGKPNLATTSLELRKSLRFRVRNATGKVPMAMGYLERGLGWTPSYLIELKDKNTAEMTMQAVVVNDAEDLAHTDLFFVVGFPNFRYANIDSPMSLRQTLPEMMNALNSRTGARDSGIASQMMVNSMSADQAPASAVELTPSVTELAGDSEQDLFLYSRPDATLKKGERALYNVFTTSLSYDEIYEWEVHDTSRVDFWGNYQAAYQREPQPIQNAAWHSLKLKNGSKFPWTTAPAMVIHGAKPIAQETLSYTPKGATGILKLTIASDIHVAKEESEIERTKAAVRSGGNSYDAITVEGTLQVHNYKNVDAPLHVTRNLVGEVVSASHDGKSRKTAIAIQALNPSSVIEWEVSIKAGEQISIKYRYKFLVRS